MKSRSVSWDSFLKSHNTRRVWCFLDKYLCIHTTQCPRLWRPCCSHLCQGWTAQHQVSETYYISTNPRNDSTQMTQLPANEHFTSGKFGRIEEMSWKWGFTAICMTQGCKLRWSTKWKKRHQYPMYGRHSSSRNHWYSDFNIHERSATWLISELKTH